MAGIIAYDMGDAVKVKNGVRQRTTAIFWGGTVFKNVEEAAEAAGVKAKSFGYQMRKGGPVNQKEARRATIEEVKKQWPKVHVATAVGAKKKRERAQKTADYAQRNADRDARIEERKKEREAARAARKPLPVLYGVRWPDGHITLRMPGVEDFFWDLESEEDIPYAFEGRVDWIV